MSLASSEVTRVLHVIGSPKGDDSTSTRIARAFLDAYQDAHPAHEITTLDVWTADLPRFGRNLAIAKLAPLTGEARTAEQEAEWQQVAAWVAEFAGYDKLVISTPMWNFGLPYRLKHYIDLLIQPGLSFGLNEAFEHVGLLADRPVQLVLTRSSPLPEGSPEDFQLPYLKHVLGFIGLCITFAGQSAQRVVDAACEIAGSTALYRRSPLKRLRRDMIAISSHLVHQRKTYAAAGGILLGAEPGPTFF